MDRGARYFCLYISFIVGLLLCGLANAALMEIEVKYLSQDDAAALVNYAHSQDLTVRNIVPSESSGQESNITLTVHDNAEEKQKLIDSYLEVLKQKGSSPNLRVISHKECGLGREIWCKMIDCDVKCVAPYKK